MIYFIGAGPGDPELITVKGQRLIRNADIIIYAGSLVNPMVLEGAKEGAMIYNSASMTLDDVIQVMVKGVGEGKAIARVHTGDPSIYGAIREQMDVLDTFNIDYEVVPGVSSFLGTAAALKKEYTLPDVTQTVILTRMAGRTPVPEEESIEKLAVHQATMIIFLSISMIEDLVLKLITSYKKDTPVAVVYKATWPDQKIVKGTLETIAESVKREGIKKTALVVIGNFLGDDYALSKLYDSRFSHEYREASQ